MGGIRRPDNCGCDGAITDRSDCDVDAGSTRYSCGTVMMICVSPEVLRMLLKRTTAAMRVGWVLSSVLNAPEGRDAALEARVHGLQPEPGRPLEDDGQEPLPDEVLRDDQLLDAVAVEIDGERAWARSCRNCCARSARRRTAARPPCSRRRPRSTSARGPRPPSRSAGDCYGSTKASERVSFPMMLEKAAPIGRNGRAHAPVSRRPACRP